MKYILMATTLILSAHALGASDCKKAATAYIQRKIELSDVDGKITETKLVEKTRRGNVATALEKTPGQYPESPAAKENVIRQLRTHDDTYKFFIVSTTMKKHLVVTKSESCEPKNSFVYQSR